MNKKDYLKTSLMSHNVCSVNVRGDVYDFQLCYSLVTGNFWFVGSFGCHTYSSPVFASSELALSNLCSLISFIGGPVRLSDRLDDAEYLRDLFSDVVFASRDGEVR